MANGKIFNRKSFNYLVWTPLGSRANLKIQFWLQAHFKVSAAWYCSHYLPPVSLTMVANLLPVSLTPVENLPPVSTTLAKLVAKFATDVADARGKFSAGVVDTGGAPWLANISANFRKNLKQSKWDTLGLGENWFSKNQKQKIAWHCHFNPKKQNHLDLFSLSLRCCFLKSNEPSNCFIFLVFFSGRRWLVWNKMYRQKSNHMYVREYRASEKAAVSAA